jgi:hypothetical protein
MPIIPANYTLSRSNHTDYQWRGQDKPPVWAVKGSIVTNDTVLATGFIYTSFQYAGNGSSALLPLKYGSATPAGFATADYVGFSQARKLLRSKDSSMYPGSGSARRTVLDRKQHTLIRKVEIAVVLAFIVLVFCTIAGVLRWCKSKAEEEPIRSLRTELCPSAPRRYELAVATHMFANEAKIGRGGFGPVYRGCLGGQNRDVAIKVLAQGSSVQGKKEFEAEVRVMTRLRHRNIVQLIGWCDGPGGDLLLVYEFVPNGSLDKHLYDPQRLLPWSDRYPTPNYGTL